MTSVNEYLVNDNLFALFRMQLKKDFEGSGLNAVFTETLPRQFNELSLSIVNELGPIMGKSSLGALLYRVDISERQIGEYRDQNASLTFVEVISQLIIKRVLQKVILKKKFSG
jgi:hypothetical protein